MTVSILGTDYLVRKERYNDIPIFNAKRIVSFCDTIRKEIIYCDLLTHPSYTDNTYEFIKRIEQSSLRNEIVHAFLAESGLRNSSDVYEDEWTISEEMFDRIALQSIEIYKAWKETGAID